MSISKGQRATTQRELIVILKPDQGGVAPAVSQDQQLDKLLEPFGARLNPVTATRSSQARTAPSGRSGDASGQIERFRHVMAPDEHLDALREQLQRHPAIEGAYIKPAGAPPVVSVIRQPTTASETPDFRSRQGYLDPAPSGVDVLHAWGVRGGRGAGIKIIDCEWAWNFSHEDLLNNCDGAVVGVPSLGDDNHGTAVIGTLIGNDNGFGITGIAPDAQLATACFDDTGSMATSAVITQAADRLAAGDILLLEIHRPGPSAPNPPQGQVGYIPIEWWPDDFHAIQYATAKGVIVVEAGGNGSQDLDDPIYSTPVPGFPADWQNPFAQGGPDSGAIIVGAGNPPSGTHGRITDNVGFNELYVDRARCGYSNYGLRIDCQAWGWEVTTTGIGDLQATIGNGFQPVDHNRLYTDTFDGTSSASPIVTGVLACVQGAVAASGRQRLTPSTARELLRTCGSPQQSAPDRPASQRIGPRPDLRAILQSLEQSATPTVTTRTVPEVAPFGSLDSRPKRSGTGWIAPISVAAALGLAVAVGLPASLKGYPSPLTAWYLEIGLIALFLAGLGWRFEDTCVGAAIDSRNKLSLSRFQILLWTVLFIATLLVTFSWNAGHSNFATNGGSFGVNIPATVWLLMGMSGVSAVGGPLILNQKPNTAPTGAPLAPSGMNPIGVVVARPLGSRVSFADLIRGDELGNATTIDVGKVQQILISLIAIASYGLAVAKLLAATNSGTLIKDLPAMDSGFLALVAAGHATYLSYKAVPHT